ncbi:KAT8 regulatory NSL complex subunit 2 [Halotydeus destructor]|nr:KAT8 regulatory NSL complex subunit 2 [Halotydeus destructor]
MSRNWSTNSSSSSATSPFKHGGGQVRQSPNSPKARTRVVKDVNTNAACRELCNYTHRICLQNRLEGFEYCIRHILVDKSAPFKQCSFVHPQSGKRCPNAARRTERKDSTLCPWHIKKLYLKRKQNEILSHRKDHSNGNTLPTLLKDLEHHCSEDHAKRRRNEDWQKIDDDTTTATDELREKIAEAAANLNESDSEDDTTNPLVEDSLRSDIIDSDSESIDSDQEDPLKHAGVYTAEEVSYILSEKMHRLQKLYIEQFKHLRQMMKDKYRKYCQAALTETQSIPVSDDGPDDIDREMFKAMVRYHRYHGKEALLKRQVKEKRKAITEGANYQPSQFPVCIYAKGEETCHNRSLPCSHYCSKHILFDVHQVLFRPCASGQRPCLNPVISFVHKNTCVLHTDMKADNNSVKKILGQEEEAAPMGSSTAEPELFQTMDDIASLQLDAVVPTSLFALDQYCDLETEAAPVAPNQ